MAKIALVVDYEIHPDKVDQFMELIKGHVGRVKANEPGCVNFDVMVARESGHIMLYEVYADQAALDAHTCTDYLATYREAVAPLAKGRTLTICDVEDV